MPKLKHTLTLRDTVARNIKIRLAAHDMSRAELAQSLGVTVNAVGKWLRGDTGLNLDTLEMISRALKISPAELLAAPEEVAENCRRMIC